MDLESLTHLLNTLKNGETDVDQVITRLQGMPFEDIGVARIDHHREIRTGMPEVVYGPGKTASQIVEIVTAMAARETNILVTRLGPDKASDVLARLDASGAKLPPRDYDSLGRTLTMRSRPFTDRGMGTVAVVCAGTSDLPVAHEALATAALLDNRTDLVVDVGVAGVHRILAVRERLADAQVVIVVAGMEGALPGVVSGLIGRPVIGVPTSTGYGTAFNGLSALLTMLNACAPGLTVVNIDNGYGAACAASLINRKPT